MCGIAGFQGRFPTALLSDMAATIAHRGPDGDGCAVFGGDEQHGERTQTEAGFAHRRLAIIDLSDEGRQPMATICAACGSAGLSDLALTYNGEVYNYREIWRDLEPRGHVRHSRTDSEVLLHLYAESGLAMPEKLNGIFAFAIRDGRSRGRPPGVEQGDVFIARDQLGVKPLYYTETSSGVLFASELKALLVSPIVQRQLNLAAVHQMLAYLWTPGPDTVLAGIRKLEPGCALLLRGGVIVRSWRYYELPYGQPILRASEDALADELHDLLATAVQRQMMADVHVGAFLSGGLDSSSVVAMMRRAQPDMHPTCYSIGFRDELRLDGTPADLPFARAVAGRLDVDLRELIITPAIVERLDDMLYHLDEPVADPAPINVLIICEQARRDGIKVLLSGAGGDDIFSGYRRHRAMMAERAWLHIPHAARQFIAGSARWASNGGTHVRLTPLTRRVLKAFEHANLRGDERLASYFWWGSEELRRNLYTPDFAAAVASSLTAAPLLESLARIPSERDPLNRMLFLESKHFLPDHNLNYTDKMGMAAGVEVRVPLLDLGLVDFAARVPPKLKQQGATGKAIFKRAMLRDLPRDVVHRPKSGFGAPLREWLRGDLRERVEDTLSSHAVRARGLFDPGAVRRLIELDRAGRVDGAYTIFALVCLELWCRRFVDTASR